MQRITSADENSAARALEAGDAPQDRGASISSMWRGTILESIADGVFTVDDAWRITSFNGAAERITGYARQEVIGRPCYEVFRASICRSTCALRRTLETGMPIVNVPVDAVGRDGKRLPLTVSTAMLRAPDGRRVGGVETFRDMSASGSLQEGERTIVGCHEAVQRVLDILPDVAQSEATVLVEGPPGAGKGLLSRTIHDLSPRRDGPYVRTCCSALPDDLLARELFGWVDAAGRVHTGRIHAANGGTLVLDEVGEISPALQIKLLHLVQDRVFEPCGSNEKLQADLRIVACTHRDLNELVGDGAFRHDLYYRMNVIHLRMPSLAERRDDIPQLVERFVARQCLRTGKRIRGVSEETMSVLLGYDFPGNVRELENAIEHAFVLCHNELIEPSHLPLSIRMVGARFSVCAEAGISNPRQAAEAEVIRQTLERHGGNRLAAARELGMHRTTLWRKLKQYGITAT